MRDKRIQKRFSASNTLIKICFFINQIHFENWSVVKLVLSKSGTFWNSKFKICRVFKKGSKSDLFEILDSKHDVLYKKRFKNRFFFQKFWPQFFFWMKIFFSATTFPRMHKKANIDVFTVYIDQLNFSLRASFPKKFDFLTTLFSSKADAL